MAFLPDTFLLSVSYLKSCDQRIYSLSHPFSVPLRIWAVLENDPLGIRKKGSVGITCSVNLK